VQVQQERRLTKRKTLERLTYIDLPSHNGGIVTDVSEGGLGFHAIAPVENGGPIHFSFSGGSQRIAGIGELTWTDGKRKVGGLRFTELPEEIREQIRNWPLESNLRFKAVKAAAPELPGAIGPLSVPSNPGAASLPPLIPQALPESAAGPSVNPAFSSYAPYFPQARSPETQLGKRTARLLKTIGISSLAGLVGVASYLCYREARAWLEASKESGQGQQTSQVIAPGPAAKSSSEIALVRNSSADGTEAAGAPEPSARRSAGSGAAVVGAASAAPGAPQASAASVPGPQDPTKPQTAPAANELLLVQVAAYTRQADALNLVDSLRAQDFIAFVSPPVTDEYYRVQLGPYTTLEAAQIGKRELEKAGFTPLIRH